MLRRALPVTGPKILVFEQGLALRVRQVAFRATPEAWQKGSQVQARSAQRLVCNLLNGPRAESARKRRVATYEFSPSF